MFNHRGAISASAFTFFALVGGLLFLAVDALTPADTPTPAPCVEVGASLQNLDYDYAAYAETGEPRFLLRTPAGIASGLSYTTALEAVSTGRVLVRRGRDNILRLCK